ncbi:hypothetical protein J5N97_000417 [Dioscorea zingiberensis]|uniref:TIR domain-containing protein n=1 Tax=Dioscorea zingiberensis TaxID=325984 RepID=A0A9D5H331_9LILI|nr:hypothetical protein J5N97_000417 [Dioscorea zingiberensis]
MQRLLAIACGAMLMAYAILIPYYTLSKSGLATCSLDIVSAAPPVTRFVKWLRAEIEMQGFSCFLSDQSRLQDARSAAVVQTAMEAAAFGMVVVTKNSFSNPYNVEELRMFLDMRKLIPIFFGLAPRECMPVWISWRGGGRKRELLELELLLFGETIGKVEEDQVERSSGEYRRSQYRGRIGNGNIGMIGERGVKIFEDIARKGKEPLVWMESNDEIEFQGFGSREGMVGSKHGGMKYSIELHCGRGVALVTGESGIGKTEL